MMSKVSPSEHAHSQSTMSMITYPLSDVAICNLDDRKALLPEEAGRNVPPELFKDILYFVKAASRDDKNKTLKCCSLVCRDWANRCRRHMFSNATLRIRSLDDAIAFRQYVLTGSQELISIATLIATIRVEQDYSKGQSFASLISLPVPSVRKRMWRLSIQGPVPANFPSSYLDTPHWRLSNTVNIPPSVTSYHNVHLARIRFPSFGHILKYLMYLRDATWTELFSLTWDGPTPENSVYFSKPAKRSRPATVFYVKTMACTDNVILCLQKAMMYPDFAACALPEVEQFKFIKATYHLREDYLRAKRLVGGYGSGSPPCRFSSLRHGGSHTPIYKVSFGVGQYNDTYRFQAIWTIQCYQAVTARTHARILGLIVVWEESIHDLIDCAAWRSEIEELSTLRYAVLAFRDYDELQAAVHRYPMLRESLLDDQIYAIVCHPSASHQFEDVIGRDNWKTAAVECWVDIDLHTLQSTGQHWGDGQAMFKDFTGSCL